MESLAGKGSTAVVPDGPADDAVSAERSAPSFPSPAYLFWDDAGRSLEYNGAPSNPGDRAMTAAASRERMAHRMNRIRELPLQAIQGMTMRSLAKVLARNDFRVDRECFHRVTYLAFMSAVNSFLAGVETLIHSRGIAATRIDEPPLFVLGHWRSGTTHLHNLLACDGNFCCPTAYQATFPNHFLFSIRGRYLFDFLAPETRPMDNVAFGADAPHEDEFALAADSTVSPYMRVLFPVTSDHGFDKLDPSTIPSEALGKWKDSMTRLVKKLTYAHGRRVVLKSPPHLGRVRVLLELFPGAKFIHIVRHPHDVYPSTKNLWTRSFAHLHLQKPDPETINELILRWYSELFDLFERDRALIPEGALHELKFEDLEERPYETLEGLYSALDLPGFDLVRPRVKAYLDRLGPYTKNRYVLDEASRALVYRRWRRTFERYDYRP